MPLYFSSHVTACLTKQALKQLMNEAFEAKDVHVLRAVASQHAGRMLLEVEARDQATLEEWIETNRLNAEWVMRIDLEGCPGQMREH